MEGRAESRGGQLLSDDSVSYDSCLLPENPVCKRSGLPLLAAGKRGSEWEDRGRRGKHWGGGREVTGEGRERKFEKIQGKRKKGKRGKSLHF